jgi:hypothetical protein
MDNKFQKFNQDFFKSIKDFKIEWFDKEGIIELDDNRVVSIKLEDLGTRDHFNGYMVEIINKTGGSVYKKFFKFRYHMDFTHRSGSTDYFHVWYNNNQLDWYISRPTTYGQKQMVDTIKSFINKFK